MRTAISITDNKVWPTQIFKMDLGLGLYGSLCNLKLCMS